MIARDACMCAFVFTRLYRAGSVIDGGNGLGSRSSKSDGNIFGVPLVAIYGAAAVVTLLILYWLLFSSSSSSTSKKPVIVVPVTPSPTVSPSSIAIDQYREVLAMLERILTRVDGIQKDLEELKKGHTQ